jgi:hypothetical protein
LGPIFLVLGLLHLGLDLFDWYKTGEIPHGGAFEANIAWIGLGFFAIIIARALREVENQIKK